VERLLGHAEAERAAQLAGLRHLATHRAEGGGGGGGGAAGRPPRGGGGPGV
jgi:hypothetical protein